MVARLALGALLFLAPPAWALDAAGACCAAKLKATGASEKQLFRCHSRAAARGIAVEPDCIDDFRAALARKFARAEARGACPAVGDAARIQEELEVVVGGIAAALRPTPGASACAARKLKATAQLAATVTRLFAREAPRPIDSFPELVLVVHAKLAKFEATFARLEATGSCLTTGDSAAVADPLLLGAPPGQSGVLLAVLQLCPACGDGVQGGTEECDGANLGSCGGSCRPDCTCAPGTCGNGVVDGGEECDGATCLLDGVPLLECSASCTCCSYASCYDFGCCDAGEVCMPYPTTGYCLKTFCGHDLDCGALYTCIPNPLSPGHPVQGMICAGKPGSRCAFPTFEGLTFLPCTPPGVCAQSGHCCLPAGAPCTTPAACCTGACTGAVCQ